MENLADAPYRIVFYQLVYFTDLKISLPFDSVSVYHGVVSSLREDKKAFMPCPLTPQAVFCGA